MAQNSQSEDKLPCSLVVLPLATRTMWNPVSPKMGMTSTQMTTMVTMETMHSAEDRSRRLLSTWMRQRMKMVVMWSEREMRNMKK